MGIYDDHDYGKNDGGKEYEYRDASKQIFLDFMDEPLGTERRNQTSGIHTSYSIGPAGQRVKIILVDVRSNKEGSYGSGDLLGEAQWEWLERELTNSDAQIHIIGSGIQVLPAAKPVQEKWGAFPQSRERLMALLAKTRPSGLILISGDVHYAELMRFPGACSPTGADIWEATSSGLTHTCDDSNSGICKLALNTLLKTAYHVRTLAGSLLVSLSSC